MKASRLALAATAFVAASLLGTPSASATGGTSPAICNQHVGGITIPYFSEERHSRCVLRGPGTLTVTGGSQIGALILSDGLTYLSQGTATQFDRGRGMAVEDTSVFENAGSFTTGERTSISGAQTALVRNDSGATWLAHQLLDRRAGGQRGRHVR